MRERDELSERLSGLRRSEALVAQSRDDWRAKALARGKVLEWMLKREWDALDVEALAADDAADDDYEATRIDRMRAALAGSGIKLVTTPEEVAADEVADA